MKSILLALTVASALGNAASLHAQTGAAA